jgi:hypothetical protein
MALKEWFRASSMGSRRISLRRSTLEFTAGQWVGLAFQQYKIRDISATGLYLVTKERWPQGTQLRLTLQRSVDSEPNAQLWPYGAPVPLTLQKAGAQNASSESQVTLRARVVRTGEDGIGMAFVLPADVDSKLWSKVIEMASSETPPDDIIGPFKMAKSMIFLSRISAPAENEVWNAIHNGFSSQRRAKAIEIALKAESIVESWPDEETLHSVPALVLRILEDASWADDEITKQFWAGLLATACASETKPETHMSLIHAFSQLTMVHVRVFNAACTKAAGILADGKTTAPLRIICAAEEMMKISGSRDIQRMDRDLEHLADLGLLERRVRMRFFAPEEEIIITPTAAGLELYERCQGPPDATDFPATLDPPRAETAMRQLSIPFTLSHIAT